VVRTLASPLVSAGAYGWPLDDAARIAVETVRATPSAVELVRFVAFGPEADAALRAAL
jgi:O-acetyl-ADP-ribose deacetylase